MKGRGTQELGKLVEQLRKAVGYDTQEQFAHAAKMHPSIYNKLTRHDTQYLRGVRADEYLRGIIAALIIDANRRSGISMNEVDAIIQVWPRPLSPTETQWLRKEAAALIANQQRTKPTPTTSVSQVIVDQNYVDMYEYLVSLSAAIKQLSQNHQKITQQLENFAKEIDKSTRDLRRYLSRGE